MKGYTGKMDIYRNRCIQNQDLSYRSWHVHSRSHKKDCGIAFVIARSLYSKDVSYSMRQPLFLGKVQDYSPAIVIGSSIRMKGPRHFRRSARTATTTIKYNPRLMLSLARDYDYTHQLELLQVHREGPYAVAQLPQKSRGPQ